MGCRNYKLVISVYLVWLVRASFPTEVFPAAQGRFHQRKPVLELHHDPDCFKSVLQPINYNENRGLSILSLVRYFGEWLSHHGYKRMFARGSFVRGIWQGSHVYSARHCICNSISYSWLSCNSGLAATLARVMCLFLERWFGWGPWDGWQVVLLCLKRAGQPHSNYLLFIFACREREREKKENKTWLSSMI